MKKALGILFLGISALFIFKVLAYSSDAINITTIGPFDGSGQIFVTVNHPVSTITSAKMYVGDIELENQAINGNTITFNIPKGATLKPGKLSTTIITNNYTYYGPERPYFQALELIGKKGGEKSEVTGVFSGSCNLRLSNGDNLSIIKDSGKYYVTLPVKADTPITGGYVECSDLKSNFISFDIKAPHIDYLITKDKTSILPGSEVYLKGKNFTKGTDDKLSIMFGTYEITGYTVKDDSTIEFSIPNQNLKGSQIKVTKNGLNSNTLSIDSYSYSNINNVTYEKMGDDYVIKFTGKFDYDLGKVQPYYGSTALTIQSTGDNYINAYFPKTKYPQITTSTGTYYDFFNYSCDYYLKPDLVYVNIGDIPSNKFFAKLDSYPKIRYVDLPKCESNSCEVEFVVDNFSISNAYRVKLNGSKAKVLQIVNVNSQNSYKIKIGSSSIIQKGYVEVETDRCLASLPYYFDYSWNMKPKIFSISSSAFKAGGMFEIAGENFTDAIGSNADDLNINMSPDLISKNKDNNNRPYYNKGPSSVKGTLGVVVDYKSGDKVSVNLSNKFGTSNGGVFYMETSKLSFLGNPEIDYIGFPDGIYPGKKMEINGIGFSSKCNENTVIWGTGTLKPTDCTVKKITVVIPDTPSKIISVQTPYEKSKDFTFNYDIGGTGYEKNTFNFVSTGFALSKDLTKDTSMDIDFDLKNTYGDIYIRTLAFNIEGTAFMPISAFSLSVGGDDSAYTYNNVNARLIKSQQKNIGYVSKVGDNKYQILFENIYIPFNKENTHLVLKAALDKNFMDNVKLTVSAPEQLVYYQTLYGGDEIQKFTTKSVKLGTVDLVGKALNCFDADSNNRFCVQKEPEQSTGDIAQTNTGDTQTNTGSQNVSSTGDKYQRLADKLTDEIIRKVNSKLGKLVSKYYAKIPENKDLQSMIKIYRNMQNTSDKLEYSKKLYEFVWLYKKVKAIVGE